MKRIITDSEGKTGCWWPGGSWEPYGPNNMPDPPYNIEYRPKPERLQLSQQQEKRVARKTKGVRNPGSGSQWKHKNDVRSEGKLWEMKRTSKKQITIKLSDWEALRAEAILSGRQPVLHIEIGNRRLVLVDEDDRYEP